MYKHTHVYREYVHDLRALAISVIDSGRLEWRHHGIGVLQAYLPHANPEVRLHIWHPDLLIPGMEKSGQIHDHRFLLESAVLVGRINHTEFHLAPAQNGAWRKWTVLNARQGAEPPQLADDVRYDAQMVSDTICENYAYEFDLGAFHKSDVSELTVTLVTKRNQVERKAVILAPHDVTPVHGFDPIFAMPNRQAVDVEKYVYRAREKLIFSASETNL